MKYNVYVQWEIKDMTGKLISRSRKRKTHSFVIAYFDLIYAMMAQAFNAQAVTTIKNTANTNISVPYPTQTGGSGEVMAILSPSGNTSYGLVVGTDNTAVTMADYALKALIGNGTGNGQLSYGAHTVTQTPTTVGSTRSWKVQRTFTNNSGSDITVHEIGIYGSVEDNAQTQKYVCLERTLSTQTITNGTTGTLTYTISMSL